MLFHQGVYFKQSQYEGRMKEEVRARAVMVWVHEHEFEQRAWMPSWGEEKRPAIGDTSKDWKLYVESAPSPDHIVLGTPSCRGP